MVVERPTLRSPIVNQANLLGEAEGNEVGDADGREDDAEEG